MRNKKVLVVGGTGFIGFHLIKKCLRRNMSVTSISRTKPSKLLVLGGGSNMLLTKDIQGLVLHIDLKGIEICEKRNETT